MEQLQDWLVNNSINVLGLAETNISGKEGFFLTKNIENYKGFWSNARTEKKKGSGVGLLINKQWEKHLGGIERISEYMITATFMFKQLEIVIIMAYLLLNDKESKKEVQKAIINKYIKRHPRTQMVIMGDFNAVADIELDKQVKTKKRKYFKPSPLIGWLERQEFKDAFRLANPEAREYSWSGRRTKSRIDYIWLSEDLANGLSESEIQNMDVCTSSDHNAVLAKIELGHLIRPYSAAKVRKEKQERMVFLYNKASKENWENYRQDLEKMLEKKISIQDLQ